MQPHRRQPARLRHPWDSRGKNMSGLPFPSPVHESEVAQSSPTLRDPKDCSPPGSPVPGVLQAGLEWVPVLVFRRWRPTPGLLPRKPHGWRSLVGCSPWGREESDTTERLHFDFSPSCIGEGNGNPLQCSCLENPRDGEAWWAAVYGVAQSRTRPKGLSSSKN